ncbi:MAG: hypothetical protein V1668_00275 [Patescibacteria group bacterium]
MVDRCEDGYILFGCGDGDQSVDLLVDHLMKQLGLKKRPHLEMLNGGALRLVAEAPIPARLRVHEQMVAELLTSRHLKRIPTLLLYAHYPCGMAGECNITLPEVLHFLFLAGQKLIEQGWDPKRIILLFHVDHDGQRKRTYYVERTKSELIFSAPEG